jgi:hypothetical protein
LRLLLSEALAFWWDGAGELPGYNCHQTMSHAWVGSQLLAAWTVQIHVVWWRLCLSVFLFGGICAAAWALERKK